MLFSGTDQESYVTKYTSVHEDYLVVKPPHVIDQNHAKINWQNTKIHLQLARAGRGDADSAAAAR